jgi:hypothetical protein
MMRWPSSSDSESLRSIRIITLQSRFGWIYESSHPACWSRLNYRGWPRFVSALDNWFEVVQYLFNEIDQAVKRGYEWPLIVEQHLSPDLTLHVHLRIRPVSDDIADGREYGAVWYPRPGVLNERYVTECLDVLSWRYAQLTIVAGD